MFHWNPVATPLDCEPREETDGDTIIESKPYRQLVGSLMYCMGCCLQDLTFRWLSTFTVAICQTPHMLSGRVLADHSGTVLSSLRYCPVQVVQQGGGQCISP